jgi:hypothetical protein
MDPWVWLAAYLVGFTLLQLLLYRRFRRNVPQGETTPSGAERAAPRAPTGSESDAGDRRICPHCGTPNEAASGFRFCRACCQQLR